MIFRIRHPKKYKINSIEKFISNERVVDGDIAVVQGYGYYQKTISNLNQIVDLESLTFSGVTNGEYHFKMYLNKFKKMDSINYYAFPYKYVDLRGASGSAIFQILKSGKIIFGGVYTASNFHEKIYLFVRPDYILNIIEKKKVKVSF